MSQQELEATFTKLQAASAAALDEFDEWLDEHTANVRREMESLETDAKPKRVPFSELYPGFRNDWAIIFS